MFVELVFSGLPIDRDAVEEALEETFGKDGGEVTGAGTGMGICHLDLEIEGCPDPAAVLDRIRQVLSELGVEKHATLNASD